MTSTACAKRPPPSSPITGYLPSYRAMLDREGVCRAQDAALIGDEETVSARIDELEAAGVDEFVGWTFDPSARDAPAPEPCCAAGRSCNYQLRRVASPIMVRSRMGVSAGWGTPMAQQGYVAYSDEVEQLQPDEDALADKIVAALGRNNAAAYRKYKHGVRDAHAKSHGVLRGELTVYAGLCRSPPARLVRHRRDLPRHCPDVEWVRRDPK